jgi:hypothetical protein
VDCGAFGCDECLVAGGGGDNLCVECRKKNATQAQKGAGLASKLFGEKKSPKGRAGGAAFGRSSVARKSRAGRRLEVHFRDGSVVKGSTYKLDVNDIGFHLVPIEPVDGKDRLHVNFADLEAIHIVNSFEGESGSAQKSPEVPAEGQDVKVAFPDGKIIEGRTLHRFDPSCPRFFIAPTEGGGGSISILVERSALDGIEMEGFKEGVFAVTEEAGEGQRKPGEKAPLSQSESMGDLYFSMKNYDAALTEYEKVRKEFPYDKRLGMKLAVCNFNRGVNFVKSRRYTEAKIEFEKVDEGDPVFEKARRKIKKIDKILKDAEKIGG